MALDAALPTRARSLALSRGLTSRVGLTLIVATSFLVRVVASAAHSVPRLFPDEYIYTSIARSLAAGHAPAVRGASAHFPALLAPLAAAPLQALADPVVAYRLTQVENALFMSLAAVPVYLIARRLELGAKHALLCAAFAVAIPDLVFASYTLSDPIAYPLVMTAIAVGLSALLRPTVRMQAAFLAVSGVATFARVQYVVLPVAYLVAAVVLDRRAVLRTQRLLLGLCALPLLGGLALGPSRVLGYYSHVTALHLGGGAAHWVAVDLFLLAYGSGMFLVPGAVVALARPKGRTELAFAALFAALAALLLLEAGLYSANGSPRFHERYLFTLLPLVPIAFGLYAKRGYPHKRAVAGLAAALLVLSQRLPLSTYVAGLGKVDSPFLVAVSSLQPSVNIGTTSLIVAVLAAVALCGALLVSRRGGGTIALSAAVALAVVLSVGAGLQDARESQGVRRELVISPYNWVDQAHVGAVTLVQTRGSQLPDAVEQMYFNRSIDRELILGNHPDEATDVYPSPRLQADDEGHVKGVTGAMLVQNWGATVRFQNGTVVSHAHTWSLWSAPEPLQLSLAEDGRYYDDWLARKGSLTVWPDSSGRARGVLTFTLFLPRHGSGAVTIHFGQHAFRVVPGGATRVELPVDSAKPFRLAFTAKQGRWLQDLRNVSVKSTPPVFHRAPAPRAGSTLAA